MYGLEESTVITSQTNSFNLPPWKEAGIFLCPQGPKFGSFPKGI